MIGASCVALGFAISTAAYRMRWLEVPGSPFVARLDREVHLTAAQRDQIEDIMRDTRFKVIGLHHKFEQDRHQMFWDAFSQIRGILTPEQQRIFDRDFKPPSGHEGFFGGHHEHFDHGEGPMPAPPAPPPGPPPQSPQH